MSSNTLIVSREFDPQTPVFPGNTVTVKYRLTAPVNNSVTLTKFEDFDVAGYLDTSMAQLTGASIVQGGTGNTGVSGLPTPPQAPGVDQNLSSAMSIAFKGSNQITDSLVLNASGTNPMVAEVLITFEVPVKGSTMPGQYGSPWPQGMDGLVVTFSNGSLSSGSLSETITVVQICVAEGTLVTLADGQRVPIERLRAGAELRGADGAAVRLAGCIELGGPSQEFVRIERGALGATCPSEPLQLCRGHPIMVGGREMPCEALLDAGLDGVAEARSAEPLRIYTLLTERRGFVEMAGAAVGTWSEAGWENFVANDPRARGLGFRRQ